MKYNNNNMYVGIHGMKQIYCKFNSVIKAYVMSSCRVNRYGDDGFVFLNKYLINIE